MRCAFDTCLLVVHRDAGAHAQGSGNGESEQGASARLQGAVGALIRRLTERAAPGLAVPVVNGCMGEAFHVRRHVTHRPRGCKVSFVKYHISVCVQNNTTNTNRARPAAPPGAAQPNGSDPARAPARPFGFGRGARRGIHQFSQIRPYGECAYGRRVRSMVHGGQRIVRTRPSPRTACREHAGVPSPRPPLARKRKAVLYHVRTHARRPQSSALTP